MTYLDNPLQILLEITKEDFYLIKVKIMGCSMTAWINGNHENISVNEDILNINISKFPLLLVEEVHVRYKDDAGKKCTKILKVSSKYTNSLISSEAKLILKEFFH